MKTLFAGLKVLGLTLALAPTFTQSASAQVSMNDATFLLPIPRTPDDLKANYLNASTMLSFGSLVTSGNLKLFDWNGIQSDIDLSRRENIDRLAVLGIRLDPCFKDRFSDVCRPQIRFVMQPVVFNTGKLDTADTGVHLFFDTTQDKIIELIRFAADYRSKFLGPNSYRAPLQIQPIIAQESVSGKFWQTMKAMLQNVLNQATPSRIAFFVMHPNERAWTLRSFDLNGRNNTPVTIAGVGGVIQRVDNEIRNSVIEFEATPGIIPRAMQGTDQTFDFLNDSSSFKRNSSRMQSLVLSVERIENPNTHLPGTIDCLSCHSTPAIKTNFRKNGNPIGRTVASFISTSLPQQSMINIFEDNYESRDFRLLGYRNEKPLIGQRVINESASIADHLNQQGFMLKSKDAKASSNRAPDSSPRSSR